jgi:hypothetical protein
MSTLLFLQAYALVSDRGEDPIIRFTTNLFNRYFAGPSCLLGSFFSFFDFLVSSDTTLVFLDSFLLFCSFDMIRSPIKTFLI